MLIDVLSLQQALEAHTLVGHRGSRNIFELSPLNPSNQVLGLDNQIKFFVNFFILSILTLPVALLLHPVLTVLSLT
jgi:hypothetical protein